MEKAIKIIVFMVVYFLSILLWKGIAQGIIKDFGCIEGLFWLYGVSMATILFCRR